jgi:hypothetical protein
MTIESVRSLINLTPFKPLVINLSDGRALRVPHRDFIFFLRGDKPDFIFAHSDGGFEVVASDLVQNVTVPPERKG